MSSVNLWILPLILFSLYPHQTLPSRPSLISNIIDPKLFQSLFYRFPPPAQWRRLVNEVNGVMTLHTAQSSFAFAQGWDPLKINRKRMNLDKFFLICSTQETKLLVTSFPFQLYVVESFQVQPRERNPTKYHVTIKRFFIGKSIKKSGVMIRLWGQPKWK